MAPFDGIIGARQVSIGTFCRAGQPIADLANIDAIRVNFSAPERFLSRLSRGAEVAVSTTAFPGHELKGKIIVIEPVLDPATRSARIVAEVGNPGRKFRPGMSANISAVLGERPNAITIPNEAIFGSGNQSFVFVVKADSTVARVALTLGTVRSGIGGGVTMICVAKIPVLFPSFDSRNWLDLSMTKRQVLELESRCEGPTPDVVDPFVVRVFVLMLHSPLVTPSL